jgi:8-oxo-dGTP pyrophosphatase MutT (NUDIX family)
VFTIINGNQAAERGFESGTWKLSVDRLHWKCESVRFGSVEYAVVADQDGKPLYDRPIYREAPHVITVPWYSLGREMGPAIGLILEERAHGGTAYWGVPRGFLKTGETPEAAALREAGEEAGVAVVKLAQLVGYINPNPTFISSKGPVVALEVDHVKLQEIRPKRNEKIYKVTFFPIVELLEKIQSGNFEGGCFEDGVSLAAIMLFLSSAAAEI